MDKALQTMISNMPEKTGKSLEAWFEVLDKQQFSKHSEAVKYLKTTHQVTHGFANTIVSLWREKDSPEMDLVSEQYRGKEALFPIYKELVAFAGSLGDDVTISPKKSRSVRNVCSSPPVSSGRSGDLLGRAGDNEASSL